MQSPVQAIIDRRPIVAGIIRVTVNDLMQTPARVPRERLGAFNGAAGILPDAIGDVPRSIVIIRRAFISQSVGE